MGEISPITEIPAEPLAYIINEVVENGQTVHQLIAQNKTLGLSMDVVPYYGINRERSKNELGILFKNADGKSISQEDFRMDDEDIQGMDTIDRSFFEEFGDRYAPQFAKVTHYKDADDLMNQVFPDIMEKRRQVTELETRNAVEMFGKADATPKDKQA